MADQKVDINTLQKAINMATKTGKVEFGAKKALSNAKLGNAKLFVIAANCPEYLKEDLEHAALLSNLKILPFPKSSWELGAICGRPHKIGILTIKEPGDSRILDYI
ncbi:MAG: 50S ribosomal protein L30e [Candidatus Hodarchaeota archaeon]